MKRRKEHGVVSIEVAIGIFPLLLMFFAWVEISYLGYVSSLVDYAISEGARQSKAVAAKMDSGKVNYETIFKNVVRESNSVWAKFVDVENFTLKNYHYQNIKDLNAECFKPEDCNLNPGSQAYQSPIAIGIYTN